VFKLKCQTSRSQRSQNDIAQIENRLKFKVRAGHCMGPPTLGVKVKVKVNVDLYSALS